MRLELSNELFFAEVEQLISQGERVTITIKGNSMRPWLQNSKHKVIVKPLADSILQCGDIALFRYKGKHILHRVVKIENDKITFSGDGNIGIKSKGNISMEYNFSNKLANLKPSAIREIFKLLAKPGMISYRPVPFSRASHRISTPRPLIRSRSLRTASKVPSWE